MVGAGVENDISTDMEQLFSGFYVNGFELSV